MKEITFTVRIPDDSPAGQEVGWLQKKLAKALDEQRTAYRVSSRTRTVPQRKVKAVVRREVVDKATIEFWIDEEEFQEYLADRKDGNEAEAIVDWMLTSNCTEEFDIDTLMDEKTADRDREIIDWNWKLVEFIEGPQPQPSKK